MNAKLCNKSAVNSTMNLSESSNIFLRVYLLVALLLFLAYDKDL